MRQSPQDGRWREGQRTSAVDADEREEDSVATAALLRAVSQWMDSIEAPLSSVLVVCGQNSANWPSASASSIPREVRNTNFISTKPGIGNLAHPCRRMKCLPVLLFADALDQHLGRRERGRADRTRRRCRVKSSFSWLRMDRQTDRETSRGVHMTLQEGREGKGGVGLLSKRSNACAICVVWLFFVPHYLRN